MSLRSTLLAATAGAGTLALASLPVLGGTALASGTPWCASADLSSHYRASDAGAGHVYGYLVLKNTSGHTCATGGYGGVSYVGHGDGTQIGAPAVRVHQDAVKRIVLKPGQRVRSLLDEVHAQNYPRKKCHPAHVDGLRVYVPDATVSQYVVHPTVGCRNDEIHLIHQRPYQRP